VDRERAAERGLSVTMEVHMRSQIARDDVQRLAERGA
jgi:hypothetical protein